MAKKKKRKHSGGKPPAYSQYLIQADKLSKSQEKYNEEVKKAWRRMQSWKKKYKIDRDLNLLPAPPMGKGSTRSFKLSLQAVKDITYKKYKDQINRIEELDQLWRDIISGINDFEPHIKYRRWMSREQRQQWHELKESWRDTMIAEVARYKAEVGEEVFFAKMKNGEIWREVVRTSRELYEVDPSTSPDFFSYLSAAGTEHDIQFNNFMTILTSNYRTDEELRQEEERRRRSDEEEFTRMQYGGELL